MPKYELSQTDFSVMYGEASPAWLLVLASEHPGVLQAVGVKRYELGTAQSQKSADMAALMTVEAETRCRQRVAPIMKEMAVADNSIDLVIGIT